MFADVGSARVFLCIEVGIVVAFFINKLVSEFNLGSDDERI